MKSARSLLAAWTVLALASCSASTANSPTPVKTLTPHADPTPDATLSNPAQDGESLDPSICPRAMVLDPRLLSAEAACLLHQYVQLDTTNPPGNELRAATFMQAILQREGIESQIIEAVPGRANLVARYSSAITSSSSAQPTSAQPTPAQPTSAQPTSNPQAPPKPHGAIMLAHHMDVVPADPSEWSVPPFSGEVKDGYLWGRGSIDNKGGGVVQLLSVLMLKRLGIATNRDVVLLAVADEESGGAHGARWLTTHRKDLFDDVEFVLNEGGAVITLPPDKLLYSVEIAQKAPLWLKLTARGQAGHGNRPLPNSATEVLVRALYRLTQFQFPIHVVPEVQSVFAQRAPAMPEPARTHFVDITRALQDPSFRAEFEKDPMDAALVKNTFSITMLQGSDKENVVPGSASAVLDVRLLPGQDPKAITEQLREVMAEPSLEIEPLLSWQAHRSSPDTKMFDAIEALARSQHPGAPVTTSVIGGFTDCNAFRALGLTCYGFIPLQLSLADIHRLHAADERVRLDSLGPAVVSLVQLLGLVDAPKPADVPAALPPR